MRLQGQFPKKVNSPAPVFLVPKSESGNVRLVCDLQSLDLRRNIYRVRPNGSRVASLFFFSGKGGSVKS